MFVLETYFCPCVLSGNFQAGEAGAILKKYDKREHQSFNKLMTDVLRPYVPEYRGEVQKNDDCYLQLQDLLCEFEAPCVMDIKMGCRTYLEEELSKAREKPSLRKVRNHRLVVKVENIKCKETLQLNKLYLSYKVSKI